MIPVALGSEQFSAVERRKLPFVVYAQAPWEARKSRRPPRDRSDLIQNKRHTRGKPGAARRFEFRSCLLAESGTVIFQLPRADSK
jgi:hypothetical protein